MRLCILSFPAQQKNLLWSDLPISVSEFLVQYVLNSSGTKILDRSAVNIPSSYTNVDVRWNSQFNAFEMVAEVFATSPKQIDYLKSFDGIKWTVAKSAIVRPSDGNIAVRTPSVDPHNRNLIFYAVTASVNNTGQGWPCAGSNTTSDYVQGCVRYIQSK